MGSFSIVAIVKTVILMNVVVANSSTLSSLRSLGDTPAPAPVEEPDKELCGDRLRWDVCISLFKQLMHLVMGQPDYDEHCCDLMGGMIEFEATMCLCTVIRAEFLGLPFNLPVSITMIINHCGRDASQYHCEP